MNRTDISNKCLVCGDRAIGTNFNVKTCESCKVFFRRNAFNYERTICPFDNNCTIDVLRRKFCKKCRLKKCLSVGMKKEWILSEDERKVRRLKIEENRRKKSLSKYVESVCDSTTTSYDLVGSDSSFSNEKFNRKNDFNIIKNFNDFYQIPDYIYAKVVELEMSVNSMVRPISELYADFNEIELNRMIELRRAARKAIDKPLNKITNEYQQKVIEAFLKNTITCDDVVKLMAIYFEQNLQKSITFGKNMSAFKSLCENDQVALIKYGGIEICSIRAVRYFNFEEEYWTLVVDCENSFRVHLDLLKTCGRNTYIDHKNFLTKIGSEWDSDDVIIDLLTAIVLFNPDRPTIIHKEMIKLQQQIYMYLLQRYLFLKYRSECEAKTKFLRLLNCLTDLYTLDEKITKNWCQTDPQRRMPLMSEICDRNESNNFQYFIEQ